MGSIFNSSSESSSTSTTNANSTKTTTPFSGDMASSYNKYLDSAVANYGNISNTLDSLTSSGGYVSDKTKADYAWNQYANMDNTNLNKINSMSLNPNDDSDWVAAQDAIDANAKKQFGTTLNQANQNIIKTGMANGSGHQSALATASSNLASQLASDRAKRWTEQYNTNTTNSLKANSQLNDFYSKLSEIGIDYAKLTQDDFSALLNAYNAKNNALQQYGNAVSMGSNPTVDIDTESTTNATSETESSPSLFSSALGIAGLFSGGK